MKRSIVRVFLVAAVVACAAVDASAGWRSADRRALEDDYEEPPEYEVYLDHDDGHGRYHDGHRDFDRRPDTQPFVGTQPYWGTMRPYWNAGEPPGVIHRQPRTEPLRIPQKR